MLEFEGLTEEELEGAEVSGSVNPPVDWPAAIAAAEARGFQSAIEALRNEAAYREWAQSVRTDAGYWPLGWESASAYLAATRTALPRTEACTSQCEAGRFMRERDEARAEVKVLEGALDGNRIATHNMQRLMEDALAKQWAAEADQEHR